MGEIRLRKDDGNAPFTHRIWTLNNVPMQTLVSNAREQVMGVDPDSFIWEVEDGTGKKTGGRVDAVTKAIMKTVWNGFNTPNGNPDNHKASIDAAVALGLNMQGVVFGIGDAFNIDSDLDSALWTTQFDHINGTPLTTTDITVKYAREKNMPISIMFDCLKSRHGLNGVGGRTRFYGDADLMKRVDGSNVTISQPPLDPNDADFAIPMVGSIMAPAYRSYYKLTMMKMVTRYRDALNDGTILWVSPKQASTAESHFEMRYHYNNTETGDADGDYHPLMVSAFVTHLQSYLTVSQFNAKFGTSIGSWGDITAGYLGNDRTFSTPIRQYWYWFRNEQLAVFYDEVWDYVQANVPGLTRTAAGGLDMGSLTDPQGKWRGCWNIGRMLKHPFVMMVKSNDGLDFPENWCTTLLASLAETYNCVARVEPTGANNTMSSNQGAFDSFVNYAKARNVGISFIDAHNVDYELVQSAINRLGIPAYRTKTARNVIKSDGNTCIYNYNLSRIIGDGGAFFVSNNVASGFDAVSCGSGVVPLITITDEIAPVDIT